MSEIKGMRQEQVAKAEQAQQSRRRLKDREEQASVIVAGLRDVLRQMLAVRQQGKRAQSSHLRQLRQIKQDILGGVQTRQNERPNKKVVQYNTPDGNRVRVQLQVNPKAKCCVAQSLAQKTRIIRNL
jgi:hypothetical protein